MEVEIRRSARRKRNITARREGGRTIVLMPAHLSAEEEQRHVEALVARLDAREERRRPTDEALHARALRLSDQYLQGRAVPASVRWVPNQTKRWGSCTVEDRTIRLSDRLVGMPEWVVDSVLVHELAHLIESNHGPQFRALVERYPHHLKAEGFLLGVSWRS